MIKYLCNIAISSVVVALGRRGCPSYNILASCNQIIWDTFMWKCIAS